MQDFREINYVFINVQSPQPKIVVLRLSRCPDTPGRLLGVGGCCGEASTSCPSSMAFCQLTLKCQVNQCQILELEQ